MQLLYNDLITVYTAYNSIGLQTIVQFEFKIFTEQGIEIEQKSHLAFVIRPMSIHEYQQGTMPYYLSIDSTTGKRHVT